MNMADFVDSVRAWKILASAVLKTKPEAFLPLARIRQNKKRRCVTRKTDIVIEGYWRCGNHFATYAFMVAQPHELKVAHHFHAPAQLILAARWNIPAILLIREPREAVLSSTIYMGWEDPAPLLRFYNIFHSAVLSYKEEVVVSEFGITTSAFGATVNQVNAKYGTRFISYEGDDKQAEAVNALIAREHSENMGGNPRRLPLPSPDKELLKARIRDQLNGPRCAPLVSVAEDLYAKLI